MKVIISILLIFTIIALGAGLFFLIKDSSKKNRLLRSLTIRIGLSVTIFVILFVSYRLGYLHPHGI
ncbi:MAG: twin transmembrane helix small protein [Methylacidiphilales bacterium]|nr:twin transmembrane helix small protein [Candidatus Methylacidiphilales bacterium]